MYILELLSIKIHSHNFQCKSAVSLFMKIPFSWRSIIIPVACYSIAAICLKTNVNINCLLNYTFSLNIYF